MKSILIIHGNLGGGGAERVLIDILNSFDTSRYNVDFLLILNKGIYIKDIPSKINFLGSIYHSERPFWKWFIARLHCGIIFERGEIRKKVTKRYDTIISFMENGPFKYHSLITDKAEKNITWVHTDLLNNHYSKYSFLGNHDEARAYNKMDKIVFVSENARTNFRKLFHINEEKLKVIHNPIDVRRILSMCNEFEVHKDKFTISMVGRFCPQKRYDRFIHAVNILINKGCDLTVNILGAGELESEMRDLVKSLKISQYVNFLGFQSNPYPYIKKSDVLCLSSDAEGYPTVICESMVLGTAVVATDIVGSRELLDKNKYGLLSELSSESLAENLFKFYSNSDLLNTYKRLALHRSESFSISKTMNEIYSVI